MTKAQLAKETMLSGYNCAQSVVKAYAADAGLDPDTIIHLAFPFGGGFARQGLVCGAVSGAAMILGMQYGRQLGADPEYRAKMYARAGDLVERFKARNGGVFFCRDLIGYDVNVPEQATQASASGVFKTKCPLLVESAAEVLEEMLAELPQ